MVSGAIHPVSGAIHILVGRLSDGSWVYSHACWHLPGTFTLQYFGTQWLDQYDTLT
jgi:hypothetical protein